MREFSRRTLLKATASLPLLSLPFGFLASKAGALDIRMIEDASMQFYGPPFVPAKEFHAGTVYRSPKDISEDWAELMLEFGLAERVLM